MTASCGPHLNLDKGNKESSLKAACVTRLFGGVGFWIFFLTKKQCLTVFPRLTENSGAQVILLSLPTV
jgi:hypothetical protein